MKQYQSLSHTRWDCKYHVVFIPKRRKKRVIGALRRHMGEPAESVAVEFFAEVAAMEFLFPYCCRIKELAGQFNGNFLAIAEKYRTPQVLVEKYLSKGYMEFLVPYSRHK